MFPTETVDNVDTLLFAVVVLGLLIFAGVLLRLGIRPLRRLFLPAALIGGVLGLALGPYGLKVFPDSLVSTWAGLPGTLATIVFAPLLMGVKLPRIRETYDLIVPQLLFGYMTSFLLTGVAMLTSAVLLIPVWHVDRMFGSIVEVGWPGGHGTAGAMVDVYSDRGWTDGGAVALTSATVGLIFGIVAGMALVNWGIRHGYAEHATSDPTTAKAPASDILRAEDRTPIGLTSFNKDLVDSMSFHLALVAGAIIIGLVLQYFIDMVVPGIPLFPLAMIGGGVIQLVLNRTPLRDTVDAATMRTIQGLALDLLIVSAVASIALPAVLANAIPLATLMVLAAICTVGIFFIAGPRVFQQDWFEQAIVNFGSSTGVASVGLMLLRAVDPDLTSVAGRAYALRAPFLSPFIGGGLITTLVPIFAVTEGPALVGAVSLGLFLLCLLAARLLGFWKRPQATQLNQATVPT